ncbi:MAG: hypothetical protein JSR50_06725 [Proteobacteria bacterium]|nr:hypothetical protein [Pseudomonadota bacterium]
MVALYGGPKRTHPDSGSAAYAIDFSGIEQLQLAIGNDGARERTGIANFELRPGNLVPGPVGEKIGALMVDQKSQ